MGYAKWRDEVLVRLGHMGFSAYDARSLCSAATTLQRLSEVECSCDIDDKTRARMEARELRTARRVAEIVKGRRLRVDFQGDPRGCPFSILRRGEIKGAGGGVGIPGNGYSGETIDRLSRYWTAHAEMRWEAEKRRRALEAAKASTPAAPTQTGGAS